MANQYFLGQAVRVSCPFTVNSVATDPTTVSLEVQKPDGTKTTYTYALAEITKDSVGNYHKDIVTDQKGIWFYGWTGTGAVAAADQDYFEVLDWF